VDILTKDQFCLFPLIRSEREQVGGVQASIQDIRHEGVNEAVLWSTLRCVYASQQQLPWKALLEMHSIKMSCPTKQTSSSQDT